MASKKSPTTLTPIRKGDRFVSDDKRDPNRVVEVIEVLGTKESTTKFLDSYHHKYGQVHPQEAKILQKGTFFRVRTEAHDRNPSAIGRVSRVSEYGLRNRYERQSR